MMGLVAKRESGLIFALSAHGRDAPHAPADRLPLLGAEGGGRVDPGMKPITPRKRSSPPRACVRCRVRGVRVNSRYHGLAISS
jgi:hypothetical protein